ncbi:ATP-binding protein [Tissierella carlieri]|uniref:ATP-binding protein n=1 Tax=Tissierella carlieri TaxID=689904 RepID=UPI0030B87719
MFYDSVIANAILDRILHHTHVIPINGKSYHLKNILKKMSKKLHSNIDIYTYFRQIKFEQELSRINLWLSI